MIHRYDPPQHITSLKENKLWDWSWCQETFPGDMDFNFVVLKKNESGYTAFGWTDEAMEAFAFRREIVSQLNDRKVFIRAKRTLSASAFCEDSDANLDFFKDKHAEGVGIQDIPRHLRAGYLAYQRERRSAK